MGMRAPNGLGRADVGIMVATCNNTNTVKGHGKEDVLTHPINMSLKLIYVVGHNQIDH